MVELSSTEDRKTYILWSHSSNLNILCVSEYRFWNHGKLYCDGCVLIYAWFLDDMISASRVDYIWKVDNTSKIHGWSLNSASGFIRVSVLRKYYIVSLNLVSDLIWVQKWLNPLHVFILFLPFSLSFCIFKRVYRECHWQGHCRRCERGCCLRCNWGHHRRSATGGGEARMAAGAAGGSIVDAADRARLTVGATPRQAGPPAGWRCNDWEWVHAATERGSHAAEGPHVRSGLVGWTWERKGEKRKIKIEIYSTDGWVPHERNCGHDMWTHSIESGLGPVWSRMRPGSKSKDPKVAFWEYRDQVTAPLPSLRIAHEFYSSFWVASSELE